MVGFLGLGPMGRPMAARLAAEGHDVVAWNRSPVDPGWAEQTRPGVRVVDSVVEVGAAAEVVVAMLTDLPPLVDLVLGDRKDLGAILLAPGHRVRTLVVTSTVDPGGIRSFAADLAPRGVDVVDAPVSGGVGGAAAGTLSIMVGADPPVLEQVRPVLDVLGGRVTHFGPVGAGSVAKACNQLVVNTTVASLAEAVLLAERSGLDVPTLLDALAAGLASSGVLEWKRDAFSHNDFRPSGPARLAVKDLGYATSAGADVGADLPLGTAALHLFEEASAAGWGDLDNAVVLDLLRRRSTGDWPPR